MELQHVKEIILQSDKNMKRRASDSSSLNNLELDLTGLVESIGKLKWTFKLYNKVTVSKFIPSGLRVFDFGLKTKLS